MVKLLSGGSAVAMIIAASGCASSGQDSGAVIPPPIKAASTTGMDSNVKASEKSDPPMTNGADLKKGDSTAPSASNPNRVYQLSDLKKVDLKAAGQTIHAWIMDDEGKRAEGMMFLTDKDVKEDEGMIFVFPILQKGRENSFWMHNCPLGLDITYIGKNKKVINVGDGKPQNDNPVPALGDYFYVLELKRGWAGRHHLKAGDTVTIPDSLKTTS